MKMLRKKRTKLYIHYACLFVCLCDIGLLTKPGSHEVLNNLDCSIEKYSQNCLKVSLQLYFKHATRVCI